MAQNMYRVGDYVYFEVSSSAPYQIRRIEELNKAASGNVEAKVVCFYRRRDIPAPLLKIADNAERQGEIVSRPRRQLLSTSSNPEASTSNGDTKEEPKENGVGKDRAKSEEKDTKEECEKSYGFAGLPDGSEKLPPEKIHVLRQRELFLSRQIETLPATHIRGKCTVVMLSEVETPEMYLDHQDSFFYSLVYDPTNETLLADKGSIRVGEKYQAAIPSIQGDEQEQANNEDDDKENDDLMIAEDAEEEANGISEAADGAQKNRETIVYHPYHELTDRDIDQFLIIARAVGTFSRALDSSSSMKLPSLHMTAAAASRDVTLLHAMALLHQAGYDIGQATKFLVPPPSKLHYPLDADKTTAHNTVSLGGPILCRDQLEEWSPAEATLFEEAIEKYGKDFHDIRNDYLPWKSLRDIIEYYYMWKTTSRYTDMQKQKQAERESKLKQVYIPNYNKPNPNMVGPPNPSNDLVKSTPNCESCNAEKSTHWFAWGPAHLQYRLCNDCWNLWKKKGGLKRPHEYENYDLDGTVQQDLLNQRTGTVVNPMSINKGSIQNVQQQQRNGAQAQNLARGGAGAQIIARLPPEYQQQLLAKATQGGTTTVMLGTKGRVAFFLHTDLQTKMARRLAPKNILNIRKAARSPFKQLDTRAILESWKNENPIRIIQVAKHVYGNRIPQRLVEFIALKTQQAQAQATARSNGASNITPQRR